MKIYLSIILVLVCAIGVLGQTKRVRSRTDKPKTVKSNGDLLKEIERITDGIDKVFWENLLFEKDYSLFFNPEFSSGFPNTFPQLKLTVFNAQAKKQLIPANLKTKANYIAFTAMVNCDNQAISYFSSEIRDIAGKKIISTPSEPLAEFLAGAKAIVVNKFCDKSKIDLSDNGRWKWVGINGEGFDQRVASYDSESLNKQYSFVNFWWKISPLYPMHYANSNLLFGSSPYHIKNYNYTLNNSVLNCQTRQIIDKSKTYYSFENKELSTGYVDSKSKDIIPESLAEVFYRNLCR